MNQALIGIQPEALFPKDFGSETAHLAPPAPDLVDSFEKMMASAVPHAQAHDSSINQTIVGKALAEEDAQWKTVPNDVLSMMQQQVSPTESPFEVEQRLTSESIYVMEEMTQLNADMHVRTALVKSTKGSIDSLMKNQ